MRVAELCPSCASYINATCIIYNGTFLPVINATPLDSLDMILSEINDAIKPLTGTGVPSSVPLYIGQQYIDTDGPTLYIGLSTTLPNWGLISILTTTTTTTVAPTTTTTTTL